MSAGNDYGYFANPSKSWLLVKPSLLATAKSLFADTNINITSNGCRYLGSPIGSDEFVNEYIINTVSEYYQPLLRLSPMLRIPFSLMVSSVSSLTCLELHLLPLRWLNR